MHELLYIVEMITFFGCIVSGVEVFRTYKRAELKANGIPYSGAKKLIALFYVVVVCAVGLAGDRLVERVKVLDVFILLFGLYLALKTPVLMGIRKIKDKKNAENPSGTVSKTSVPAPQVKFRAASSSDEIHDTVCGGGLGGLHDDCDEFDGEFDDELDEDYEDYDRPLSYEEIDFYDMMDDD